jgi:hypothetical protein
MNESLGWIDACRAAACSIGVRKILEKRIGFSAIIGASAPE